MDETLLNTAEFAILIFSDFVYVLSMLVVFDVLFATRRNSRLQILGSALLITVLTELCVHTFMSENRTLQIVLSMVVFLIYLRLFLAGNWISHLFWLTSVLLLGAVLDGLAFMAGSSLPMLFGLSSQFEMIFISLFAAVFGITACVIIVRIKPRADIVSPAFQKVFTIACLVCLLVALSGYSLLSVLDSSESSGVDDRLLALFTMLVGAFGLVVAGLYAALSLQLRAKQKGELLEQQVAMERSYISDFDNVYTDMSTLRHDFTNHMHMLRYLTDQGDMQKLGQYLESIEQTVKLTQNVTQTGNSAIDAILSAKRRRAQQVGIECIFSVAASKQLPMDAADLVSLLGNLLDNAIEACERVVASLAANAVAPVITFNLEATTQQLCLSLQNTSLPPVKRRNKSYKTTKTGRHHGLGLERIDKIVAAHGGRVYRDFVDGQPTGQFTTAITFPLKFQ